MFITVKSVMNIQHGRDDRTWQGKPCQLFVNYMSVLLRKTWTMQVQALSEFQRAKNRYHKNIFKKTNNNNPKQGGSKTKPLWGRLQPNRRLERDLFRKGGTTAWVRDGFFNKKAVTNDIKSVTTWSRWQDLNLRPLRPERSALPNWATSR